MFQDPSFNFQSSQPASGQREPATQFRSLVVFPPGLNNSAGIEQKPLYWLEALSYDDSKVLTADDGDSIPLASQTPANPHHNIIQHPPQPELYSAFSSPAWSTTESGFSSPAYTLPSTHGTLYSTPVLASQHLRSYHTYFRAPAPQSGGEASIFKPADSPWSFPATMLASPATAVTDLSTRYVTREIHATRCQRLPPPQPRFSPSSGVSATSPTYGSQETGLQLTLHQPKPFRTDAAVRHLLSYRSTPVRASDVPDAYRFIQYDADSQLNSNSFPPEGEETKDSVQYIPPSSEPAKKTFSCSHCSRAFARSQDLTRHVKTVHSEGKQWVCCGVPMSDAHRYKISADAIKIGPMEHDGVLMIGGCGREFGRKDTYAKHLKSVKTRCVGDVDALYHSENMKKVLRFRLARGRVSRK